MYVTWVLNKHTVQSIHSLLVYSESLAYDDPISRSDELEPAFSPSIRAGRIDRYGHEPVCSMWCSRPKPHLVSLQSIDGDVMASRKEDADTTALRWSQLRRRHSGENIWQFCKGAATVTARSLSHILTEVKKKMMKHKGIFTSRCVFIKTRVKITDD